MLKNKKLIIFDMDGCLIDSENLYTNLWQIVFEKNDIPINKEEIKSWRRKGWERIRKIITAVTDDDSLTLSLREQREVLFYENLHAGKLELKPYAREFIEYLIDLGKHIAIGTSTYSNKGLLILEHFNLIENIDKVMFGDWVVKTKPNPEIYLKIFDAFEVTKDETLIFEDSSSGIQAANNAGIDVIYVPDGDILNVKDLNILKIVNDFSEVMD